LTELLLLNGARSDIKDNEGKTPMNMTDSLETKELIIKYSEKE